MLIPPRNGTDWCYYGEVEVSMIRREADVDSVRAERRVKQIDKTDGTRNQIDAADAKPV